MLHASFAHMLCAALLRTSWYQKAALIKGLPQQLPALQLLALQRAALRCAAQQQCPALLSAARLPPSQCCCPLHPACSAGRPRIHYTLAKFDEGSMVKVRGCILAQQCSNLALQLQQPCTAAASVRSSCTLGQQQPCAAAASVPSAGVRQGPLAPVPRADSAHNSSSDCQSMHPPQLLFVRGWSWACAAWRPPAPNKS